MSEASERALKRVLDVISEQGEKLSKEDYYSMLEDLDSEVGILIEAADDEDDLGEDDEEEDGDRDGDEG